MSRLPFELLLALRYLRPKRTFVSVITVISVLGVTLGVAVLIIVISVMSGFDFQLREKILGFNSHLTIYEINPRTGKQITMQDFAMVVNTVKSNQFVTNVSAFAMGPVLVEPEKTNSDNEHFDTPVLRGIDPRNEVAIRLFTNNFIGKTDLNDDAIWIGAEFARNMDLHLGDRVVVYSPNDLREMKKKFDKKEQEVRPPRDFEVRGIFDTEFDEFNSKVIVCSLQNMQDLYRLGDDVHGLMVMLKNPNQADDVKNQLHISLGEKFFVQTWEEQSPLMDAVKVEKNVMFYIMFFIVIVAAFGITCTLITFVVLKTRDIGVMKALGATNRQVMWIFMGQSMIVSTWGILTGLTVGLVAIAYRNPFLHLMRKFTGMDLFPSKIYYFTELPALIVPGDILIICGGSFLICLLAAAFPVWNASRLKPVEALRHE